MNPEKLIHEQETISEISFVDLSEAYIRSFGFQSYSNTTKKIYSDDLKRVANIFNSNAGDGLSASESIFRFKKMLENGAIISNHTRTAVINAYTWGVREGIVDPDVKSHYPSTLTENMVLNERPRRTIPVIELEKILDISSTRDKALILTILITDIGFERLRELKTSDFRQEQKGNGLFEIDERIINVPTPIARAISEHADTLESGYLFPKVYGKKGSISRQRLFQILSKYKKSLNLQSLNYSSLRRTGRHLMKNDYPFS